MINPKAFQKVITAYMVDTEINKGDLAKAAGITRPTFSKYWKNPETMPAGKLSRICDYLNITDTDKSLLI